MIGLDGLARRWIDVGLGELVDADADSDGSLVVLGQRGSARVLADGTVMPIAADGGSAIAALAGEGVAVLGTGESARDLSWYASDGSTRAHVRFPANAPGNYLGEDFLDDVAVLPDGSVVLAQYDRTRLLSVLPDGRVRRIEGTPATGHVIAVAATRDGALVVAGESGLFRRLSGGVFRRLAPATGPTDQPTVDGRRLIDAGLGAVMRLATLPSGEITGLIDGERVVVATRPGRAGRLAVAFAPRSRASLRRGVAEIIASAPAQAQLAIGRATPVRVALRAGRNRVAVHVRSGVEPQVARVSATDSSGRWATHRLTFHPSLSLQERELRRLRDRIEAMVGDAVSALTVDRCVRSSRRGFACRWRISREGFATGGPAWFRLQADGVIRYDQADRRGRREPPEFFEPLPPRRSPPFPANVPDVAMLHVGGLCRAWRVGGEGR